MFQDQHGKVLLHSDIDLLGYKDITIGIADGKNNDLSAELSNLSLTVIGHTSAIVMIECLSDQWRLIHHKGYIFSY